MDRFSSECWKRQFWITFFSWSDLPVSLPLSLLLIFSTTKVVVVTDITQLDSGLKRAGIVEDKWKYRLLSIRTRTVKMSVQPGPR